jgi:23S rRNA (pseudouridine1915-N3)-methyltransferase
MIKLTIIHVGTIKEKYLCDAVTEYEKRLSAYCVVNNIAIRDEKLPDKPSASEINAAVSREGTKILSEINPRAFTIALCVEGKKLSSEAFSNQLISLTGEGYSEICFIIGGSDGLSDDVKRAAKIRLSISDMTFPHQLMRVILLEQIYRAFNIASGGKYHK